MKIKILILLSCLLLVSYVFADPPSSASYTLVQRGFLTGNPNQASPPSSAGFELKENSILGIANDVETSTGYLHYPGFLQPTNDAPTIILPDDFTFLEDGNLIVDFAPFINDINGNIVTISVSGNTDVLVDIQDFIVTFSATPDWNGMETLTFTANDNMDRAVASDNVDVIVTPVNDDPTIVLPDDFTFDEDDELVVDFSAFVDDVDLDVLTLTVTGNAEVTVDIVGLEVTFGATENWNGTEVLTFTVDDGQGESVSFTTSRRSSQKHKESKSDNSRATADDNVNIIVTPVNDDPTIVLPDSFTFDEDDELIVNFEPYIDDVDPDVLTLSVTGNTNILVDITDLMVTFFAEANWNGTETITFIVDDNVTRATAEDSVNVIVTPVNDPPVIISWFPVALVFTVVEDTTIAFSIEVEDIDSELNFSWQVNGEPQTEITNTLVYEFTEPGDYTLEVIASDGEYQVDTTWQVHVEEGVEIGSTLIPQITKLQQNIPNPFNPETTIHFSMKDAGRVKIEIFNIKGEKIRILVDEYKNIGYHSSIWNGKDNSGKIVASGMYFYNMRTEKYHKIRKMLLIK